jgi:hypothetical protein
MGKKEPPAGSGQLVRGLAAYQETLKRKNTPPETDTPSGGGFLKTGKAPARHPLPGGGAPADGPPAAPKELSKYQKVARFLVLAGSDEGAKLLS